MRIGDILVGAGLVSKEELAAALQAQMADRKTPLGQLLKLLHHLKEDELDLVLQAQRRILHASMPGDLAIAAIKYARQNSLNFAMATEKVLVMTRAAQSMQAAAARAEAIVNGSDSKPSAGVQVFCEPSDLLQQSDEAAARQQWNESIELLEQACTIYERGEAYSAESSIPIYCRLASIYLRTSDTERAHQCIAKVTRLLKRGERVAPGSLTLLAAAARSASREGMIADADQLYKLVMPKWTELLPFEFTQFNVCLRDAIACSGKIKAPVRRNIRIGELLTESKLVAPRHFQEALSTAKEKHRPLGRVVFETGLLSAQDLRNAVRVQLMCRAAVLPAEYAAPVIKAASLTCLSPSEFFDKLNLPLENETAPPGSLAELVTKMDRLLLMEEFQGVHHPEVAIAADEVGDICLRRGETEDAEALFRRAHAVFVMAGERYQLNLAGVCLKMGRLLINQKKYPETELLLLQSLEIRNRLLGDRHADVAEVLVDLGYLYFCQANYDPAIGFLRRSWEILRDKASREQKRFLLELLIKCFEQSGQDSDGDIYREQLRLIRASE